MSAPTLHELDAAAFAATVVEPMKDVTRNPHAAVDIDLWAYAEPALERHFPSRRTGAWDVLLVMQNADGTYQHVLIGPLRGQPQLVIVIALETDRIEGHLDVSGWTDDDLGTLQA